MVNEEHYPSAPPGVGSPAKIADDIMRFAELGVQHLELGSATRADYRSNPGRSCAASPMTCSPAWQS